MQVTEGEQRRGRVCACLRSAHSVPGIIILVRSPGRYGRMATPKAGKYWQIFKRQNS